MKNTRSQGFTLVEMTIVIVIIGILVGGILYGKSLMTNSKLQTVMTAADSYATAVVNFKQTYQALPGDFSGATTLWGTDNVGCPAGGGTSGTCNGNGNGQIVNSSANNVGEGFLFWQHLNKAGMFSQTLSNKAGPSGADDSQIGVNVPAGSMPTSGFSVLWWGTVGTESDRFPGFYGNVMAFGASSGSITRNAALTPEQASQIDTKMDDGLPAYGKVRAYQSGTSITPGCTTTNVATTAAYSVSNTSVLCSILFVMGF